KNSELEEASSILAQKARELEISSRYKSEFLANMSHELRTPLNSLLLISKKLSRNKERNLTEKQVESAEIIYNSGNSLLTLINEILDLAKIESGKMEIVIGPVAYADIKTNMENIFSYSMEEKGLDFSVEIDQQLPPDLQTDQQRLEQMLKNLLSNALKFTQTGSVTLAMKKPAADMDLSGSGLRPEESSAFSVIDTGIGVPESNQLEIFEAFQQADGTTSRQYGGTGLGLSIT
ncbi:MAG: hypothetical protein GY868_14825, partial [Deltaproteobacteria bacterium]|nr:hypothetical protein [Deltaproteobacteria bacterium]